VITVGTDVASSRGAVAIAAEEAEVFATVGLHPHLADTYCEAPAATLAALEELAGHPKVVAIGEMGLDYYRNRSLRAHQQRAFEDQLGLARRLRLPIVLHCRDAHPEALATLQRAGGPWQGVVHCYSGDARFAAAYLELGLHLSFTGMLTYAGNDALRRLAAELPRDRVFVETDGPYLLPAPVRGRKPGSAEPADVIHTARALAKAWQVPLQEAARITTANARRLFSLPEP
jgi:TatD DNase family protein